MTEKQKNSIGWKQFCYLYMVDRDDLSGDMSLSKFLDKVDSGDINISDIDESRLVRWLYSFAPYKCEDNENLSIENVSEASEYSDGAVFTKVVQMGGKYYSYSFDYESHYGASFEYSSIQEVKPKTVEVVVYENVN